MAIAVVIALLVLLFAYRSQVRDLVNQQLTVVHKSETKLLEVTTAISAEIHLQPLLQKVMECITDILDADRSTLFLYDKRTGELWSNVAQGLEVKEIRFPCTIGIAGTVFSTGETINIKNAYSDDRFNKAVDKKTGYRTRSILCLRVDNKVGEPVGVVQVLNKNEGVFTDTDEQRLRAFSAQAAIALENAQLFSEVVSVKNYNEAILESMRGGVVTFDPEGRIAKMNQPARNLMRMEDNGSSVLGRYAREVFTDKNSWIATSIDGVLEGGGSDDAPDSQLWLPASESESEQGEREFVDLSVNIAIQGLRNDGGESMGALLLIEDITTEKRLRSTMARYMPKELADKLMMEGEEALGGNLQTATILFSDIRSFTSISERSGPHETVMLLNDYFTVMYDVITSNGGILDKYIGDALMAVYGAPFTTPQDADHAVQTAIDMIEALRVFNGQRVWDGKEAIDVGIGVNTGEVVSGNIGSRKRMDYTVVGDGVNLAARLESATKTYGSNVLVSEYTRAQLKEEYMLREVDTLRVKGKEQPVAIYEVLDAYGDAFPDRTAVLEQHTEALNHYRARDWVAAQSGFHRVREMHPEDSVSKLYSQRCSLFQEKPPADDWDGVWTMTTK